MTRPRVVIVGMGDTGVLSAVALARQVEVVGVSVKPLFVSGQELGFRLARPDLWARDRRVDFDSFRGLDAVRVVHGKVVGVDTDSHVLRIECADGGSDELTYDVLVIATGVSNGFWRDDRLLAVSDIDAERIAAHGRIAAARSIVVVGGGPAAIGSAAQIAERWPAKNVHLYFPGEQGLPRHHPGVWRRVRRRLEALGVVVHPGYRAVLPNDVTALTTGPVHWSTGQQDVTADVVLWAIGKVRPHTEWLPAALVDHDGFVRVHPDLRVCGVDDVFAIGDVAATDPLRTSARNRGHRLLERNVRAHLCGRPLRDYRPHERRWGSVLGPMRDGMVIYAPTGHGFRFPSWTVDSLLRRIIVRRGIYGGMR